MITLRDSRFRIRPRLWLALIVLAYAVIASLYAVYTPPWQAPDEPAHYNYIRDLAEGHRLPLLQPGDYDQAYLEEIKARRFPPDMSIASIRYESHQPPLYYVLAVPAYWIGGGRLIPIRLFSVVLGIGFLLVTYRLAREVFPHRADLALGVTAFAAFLPQHVAMSAAVNNDILEELILASCVTLSLAYIRGEESGQVERRRLLLLGVLIGLGFLTKTWAYLALPLALLAIVWRGIQRRQLPVRDLGLVLVPSLVLGMPWWIRNWVVYGPWDVLGLQRHNMVVVGQPRTAEWIARMGWEEFLRQAGATTFRSFWGQFGWMGVLMDSRIYLALGILSGVVAVGCLWALWELARKTDPAELYRPTLGLLGAWLLLTVVFYVWYNVTFVQHQGRYLFPALPVWGMGFALGVDRMLRPRVSRWLASVIALVALAHLGLGMARGDLNKWFIALSGGATLALGVNLITGGRWHGVFACMIYVGLGVLDLLALFGFILPQLTS